ncbi:GTP-binding protein [candidate division KSB1 bacterium]|nr:GTP-binding protein [candidate division KSB1 bacterium]
MKQPVTISKKICMLGAFGVGKTSLVRRFVYQKFDEKYLSTIGVQISQKLMPPVDLTGDRLQQHNFILWDLAHIEKFTPVIKNYFRGSHGAIIVFDLTRPEGMEQYSVFLDPYLQMNPDNPLVFVANKNDLFEGDPSTIEAIETLGRRFHAPHLLTSAKSGENVEEIFQRLSRQLVERQLS